MAENQSVSNGDELGAECIMKKIGKVCKSQQRMQDETVSRNVAAVSRNPGPTAPLNDTMCGHCGRRQESVVSVDDLLCSYVCGLSSH